jgi:hypothetical protein
MRHVLNGSRDGGLKMRIFLALLVILFFVAPAQAQSSLDMSEEQLRSIVVAVGSVCPLVVDEAQLREAIKEEKANPTGVVNLRTLHTLGQALQSARAQLATERKRNGRGLVLFRRWAGKNLDLGFCVVHEQQREADEDARNAEAVRGN